MRSVQGITRLMIIAAALVLGVVALAPAAGAQVVFQTGSPGDCRSTSDTAVCGLIEIKAKQFTGQGTLGGMTFVRTSAASSIKGGSTTASSPGSFWELAENFSNTSSSKVTFAPKAGALSGQQVQVELGKYDASGNQLDGVAIRCVDPTYFTCLLPWTVRPDKSADYNVYMPMGIAIVRSHPVIVKVVNQTDQALQRSTEARTTGMIESATNAGDSATIAALNGDQAGFAYYQYYRDTSEANVMTVAYTFLPGGTGVLTGAVIDVEVAISDTGVATTSCRVDQNLLVNLSCAGAVVGNPLQGTTMVLVSVAA